MSKTFITVEDDKTLFEYARQFSLHGRIGFLIMLALGIISYRQSVKGD